MFFITTSISYQNSLIHLNWRQIYNKKLKWTIVTFYFVYMYLFIFIEINS